MKSTRAAGPNPLKVVRVAPTGSGTGRYAWQLASALAPDSELVSLLVDPSRAAEHTDSRRVFGVRTGVYSIDVGLNSWLPRWSFRRLRAEWSSPANRPATVHYASLDVPPLGTPAIEVVTLHDSPRVYATTRLYRARSRYRWTLSFRRARYRRFAHVLAQSEYVRGELEADGFRGEIEVISTAPDPRFRPSRDRSTLRRSLGLPEDRPIVLSVSSDEPRKNLPTVRAVARRLGDAVHVVRVGPGIPEAINLPRLSDDSLAAAYACADALILPSLEEGLGLPVLEAFASGLPVVASRIPAIAEVADGAARLTDASDVEELVAAIREVLEDPEPWRTRGLARAERYAWPEFRRRLRAYYGRLGVEVSQRPPRGDGSE